jgi:hypothetical protein
MAAYIFPTWRLSCHDEATMTEEEKMEAGRSGKSEGNPILEMQGVKSAGEGLLEQQCLYRFFATFLGTLGTLTVQANSASISKLDFSIKG